MKEAYRRRTQQRRETAARNRAAQARREEASHKPMRPYRWTPPAPSPEPAVSHTWRLLDEVTYPPRIWYGGLLLLMARCANCGGRGEFSEGAWETTVALGDGPCPDPRSDAASHYPSLY